MIGARFGASGFNLTCATYTCAPHRMQDFSTKRAPLAYTDDEYVCGVPDQSNTDPTKKKKKEKRLKMREHSLFD